MAYEFFQGTHPFESGEFTDQQAITFLEKGIVANDAVEESISIPQPEIHPPGLRESLLLHRIIY